MTKIAQVSRESQAIKRQIKISNRLERPVQIRSKHSVVVSEFLYHWANANKLRMPRQSFKRCTLSRVFKINPIDNYSDIRGQVSDPL